MARLRRVVIGAGLAVVVVTACVIGASTTDPISASSTRDASTPNADVAPVESASCSSLLASGTRSRFGDFGWSMSDDHFIERIRENKSTMAHFVDYGGVACRWGVDLGDECVLFAWSPIKPEDAEAEKTALLADGASEEVNSETGLTRIIPTNIFGYTVSYVFSDGYWAYFLNNGYAKDGEAVDLMPEILSRAPAF
jgi:hypothetical protein